MDINDSGTILADLQSLKQEQTEENGSIYILTENNTDLENYTLKLDDVFYLSLDNDEQEGNTRVESTEETEILENNYTEESCSFNMEFLERITLPDGTEAFLSRDNSQEEFISSDSTLEVMENNEILLQNVTQSPKEDSLQFAEEEEVEENQLIFANSANEEDESNYDYIQLEDGSLAMIEKTFFNEIVEQNKKSKDGEKNKKQTGSSNSSGKTKSYKCPTEGCSKAYGTVHHLKVHMRVHNGNRPYKCSLESCGKTFSTGYSLKAHARTHTGEKPYACKFNSCTKRFKTSGDLHKHNRIHTGEKPFLCPVEGCGRSFTTSNIRKVHVRSHTGERPYQCPEPGCNKAFASATNYKNHIRIHSGEKPYKCPYECCNKRFTEYSSLYKHQLVHNNDRPSKCEYCARSFRQKASLVAHKRSVHSIIITDSGTEIMVKLVDNENKDDEETSEEKTNEGTKMNFYFVAEEEQIQIEQVDSI